MRIFFKTTQNSTLQGDLLECSTLIGLRNLIGENVIDFPRKKVLYGEFDESPKDQLHGRGFTLFNRPIKDIKNREFNPTKEDILIYGVVDEYGEAEDHELNNKFGLVFYLDGGDWPVMRRNSFYFKRELMLDSLKGHEEQFFPTGFGIPQSEVTDINLSIKDQLFAKTYPKKCFDDNYVEQGRTHHIFTNVGDYYNDIARSWFSLTCKKGGWDQLRHLEAVAMGTVVLWKDFEQKPKYCSPQFFPAIPYHTKEEAYDIMNKLVMNGEPTEQYLSWLNKQRNWLFDYGTCEKRALQILKTIYHFIRR